MNDIVPNLVGTDRGLIASRPLEETFQLIDSLNLDCIQEKLCKPLTKSGRGGFGWPEEGAKKAISAYRGYLKLVAKTKLDSLRAMETRGPSVSIQSVDDSLPPVTVDIVWHAHILFTKKYFKDCMRVFGYYLHHAPHIQET